MVEIIGEDKPVISTKVIEDDGMRYMIAYIDGIEAAREPLAPEINLNQLNVMEALRDTAKRLAEKLPEGLTKNGKWNFISHHKDRSSSNQRRRTSIS